MKLKIQMELKVLILETEILRILKSLLIFGVFTDQCIKELAVAIFIELSLFEIMLCFD